MTRNSLSEILHQHAQVLAIMQQDTELFQAFDATVCLCTTALSRGNKILFVGNGGSAADAQHWAAELVVRFRHNRKALPAIALCTDSSVLTAIGNDFGFENLFSRQIEALGQPGDILIAITTSGKSSNMHKACRTARYQKMTTIGFTGLQAPEDFISLCDVCLTVPTTETARIQEIHEILGHALCGALETHSMSFP
ncbi:MAG: SIS domain-containing protein [Holosporales bacterium]|nr:SIS domain-containing protein [Holosporales bacterium]